LNSHTDVTVAATTASNIDYSDAADMTSALYIKHRCGSHSIHHCYFNFSYPNPKTLPREVLEALHNLHFRDVLGFILALMMDSNDLSSSTFVVTTAHQISQNVLLVEVVYESIAFSFI